MDKVRMAIVGCGTISQLNVPGYLQHPDCEVVALCDPNSERAAYRAKQWGISPKIYTDYADVLNDSQVDAVELLTPTHLHPQQIIDGLNAGKHVSCQKPISSTVAETLQIAEAVRKARTKFRVTENFIFYPPIVKAKELLDSGAIGEPNMVRIRTVRAKLADSAFHVGDDAMEWRRDPSLHAGGMMYDDGWHKYATAIWWIGEIEKIQAIVTKTDDHVVEVPSVAMWKFKNRDCLGVFDYSSSPEMEIRGKYYSGEEFFEIQGTKGAIYVTRCTSEMLDMPPVILNRGIETTSYQVPMDWIEGFSRSAAHFVESLIRDEQPIMDIDFSSHTLRVALAVYEASRTERPVEPDSLS
ncbi:MAG: Gfo/Idh/MocA family oxidoreductase [Chloroflexi bacterium]|nr:Gfo/Idh/MocA family oxidoreductase [Chloroflexota bacterium]MDA1228378.1 Gfo/Idh/MocA family oxidoreductase [Chloroflexota bacterium]